MPSSVFTDAYQTFIEIMVSARKDAGMTQVQLAEKLGKPQSYVSKYERGERRIDVSEFLFITEALDTDPIAIIASLIENPKN